MNLVGLRDVELNTLTKKQVGEGRAYSAHTSTS